MVKTIRIESGAIDAGGEATAYSAPITGKIIAVTVIYSGTHDMEADLHEVNPEDSDDVSDVVQTILDLGASGATPASDNLTVYPRVALTDNTGSALDLSDAQGGDTAMYGEYVVCNKLMLDVNNGTAGESVTMLVHYED
jgi:hypothetical protein